jgi:GT2 family glycosyltransferase/glycosyltransferase involved in cell wall biosynthesis
MEPDALHTIDGGITVTGLVESLNGAYLTGWAIDTARDTPCEIVVVDAAETVVAAGLADRPRSDLAAYGMGRTDFAFRLAVPALGEAGALYVYADGAELMGSPLHVGPGRWDGAVSVIGGWAEGWLHERRLGFAPPTVTLLDQDGVCLGEDQTVRGDGDPLFNPARFRIRLPPRAWRRPELALRAVVDGQIAATAHARLTLTGFLDELSATHCRGWMFCPEAPDIKWIVEVRMDGSLVANGRADLPRQDLRDLYPEGWQSGFDIKLPQRPAPADPPCTISFRLAGCDTELFDGPFAVGRRAGFVPAARRVAALAQHLPLDPVERAVLECALTSAIEGYRTDIDGLQRLRAPPPPAPAPPAHRFSVIIPVYRDVEITRACIDSVMAHRDPATDMILLINDASPDPDMAELLEHYAPLPRVHVLTNGENRGFVRTVNRGLAFCRSGDVILLNSDTLVFAGGLEELWSAAHATPGIGTATALSNNATIFSYPVSDQGCAALDDLDWEEAAAIALARNRGAVFDVPTGHGFCLLITRALLDRVGGFDEAFGRGYGEENDLCLRGADLGLRNVAAAGAFVQHRESVSFGAEKTALLKQNLVRLEARYPEYAEAVRASIRRDDVRAARWAIDAERLARDDGDGRGFVLVVRNWLEGGTRQAIVDIESRIGYAGAKPLDLCVDASGAMRLCCGAPRVAAVFAANEHDALFALLDRLRVHTVMIHQLLGFGAAFVEALLPWCQGRAASYYLHDFYPLCPRVTLIDALGEFCGAPDADVCARCVDLAGMHDAARMTELTPAQHRALFDTLLRGVARVVAPSANAAGYLRRVFPALTPVVEPHPEPPSSYLVEQRAGSPHHVALLGAMGPHKGSATLLEIAQRAWMTAPELRFHVIGYTDIDAALRAVGNVEVSGPYKPFELPARVAASGAQIALFLHGWPETFSYTLSEAVQLGLVPLVPDIGAPADRVRAAGYGHVFGFPIQPAAVVALLHAIAEGRVALTAPGASPSCFAGAA